MLKGLGNWLRRVSRNRTLRRIDRLMGLSDMKLGRKTRKYFKKLRRSLNMTNSMLKANEAVRNTILSLDFEISIMWSVASITITRIFCGILRVPAPIVFTGIFAFPVLLVLMVINSPSIYSWPARYRSRLVHTGAIGKVMDQLWKNNDSYFEGSNQMASLLNMDMDYLDEPKYWSDEDYGRFMRIVLSYAFIYEFSDGHPNKEVLSEFINSDEVHTAAREVLNDVRERKNRILDADTSKEANNSESSTVKVDSDTIRSKDIQVRIADKADELRTVLDNGNLAESKPE